MIIANRGFVPCKPFAKNSNERVEGKGMAWNQSSASRKLDCLEIIGETMDDGIDFYVGDSVCVNPQDRRQPWALEVFEVDGISFILVPLGSIKCFLPTAPYEKV